MEKQPIDNRWVTLTRLHKGHRFLDLDPLYVLNEELIKSIKVEVPDFFSEEEELFELNLLNATEFGFWHQSAIGLSPDPNCKMNQKILEQQKSNDENIERILKEEFKKDGFLESEQTEYFREHESVRKTIDDNQYAYIGWLVTNRAYRDERDSLMRKWELKIKNKERFPTINFYSQGGQRDSANQDDWQNDMFNFYYRWGLRNLVTWDWPSPMEPELNDSFYTRVEPHTNSGVNFFVPYYLLRGGKLNLQSIARRSAQFSVPPHLLEWVCSPFASKRGKLGNKRLQTIAYLFRYWELALKRRYEDSINRKTHLIENAFAKAIDRDRETVRKLRQELTRSLNT